MQALFWISLFVIFYTYLGYGLLLFLLNAIFKRKKTINETLAPHLTFIVPAYNEGEVIEEKIKNCLALHYPVDKISFVFITDGSVDTTWAIVSCYPKIKLMHEQNRGGKSAAINRAMQTVQTDFVVFSDANVLLHADSLLKLMRHYANEKVGGVSGEKRIYDKMTSTVGFGERLYWQYESLLKKANADFYTIVGAAGELFSIRTKLYQPLDANIILDDFVISANVCRQGYRFLYEEEAYSVESPSSSLKEERKRKIRISAGCFQALFLLKQLLNPFKSFAVAFQYFSHRMLRWAVCPFLLPAIFFINIFLVANGSSKIYIFTLLAQCIFYFLAVSGWGLSEKKILKTSLLLIPYYFVFMVLSQYAGCYRFVTKKQTVFWEKADRESMKKDK